MLDEESVRLGSALRERRRVILLCAPLTVLFSIADTLALHGFSWRVFGVRLMWTAQILIGGLLLGRLDQRTERIMLTSLGAGTGVFFCIITWMTGGYSSPMF